MSEGSKGQAPGTVSVDQAEGRNGDGNGHHPTEDTTRLTRPAEPPAGSEDQRPEGERSGAVEPGEQPVTSAGAWDSPTTQVPRVSLRERIGQLARKAAPKPAEPAVPPVVTDASPAGLVSGPVTEPVPGGPAGPGAAELAKPEAQPPAPPTVQPAATGDDETAAAPLTALGAAGIAAGESSISVVPGDHGFGRPGAYLPPGTPVGAPGAPGGPVAAPGTGPSTVPMPAVPGAPAGVGAATQPATRSRVGSVRRTRKARLRLSRLDPWSVMKTAFLFSIAAGIMLVVAVYAIWSVISASQLFDSVNEIVRSVVSTPGDTTPFRLEEYINTQKVMGVTALIAVVDVVIFTAVATLGSFLYNLAATMLGGLEVTLAED